MNTNQEPSSALAVTPRSPLFPIQSEYEHATRKQYPAMTIPWAMIAPHEAQASKNHMQSLATLARRGGLGRCEACAVLEDRPWRRMTDGEADAKLAEHVRSFLANIQCSDTPGKTESK